MDTMIKFTRFLPILMLYFLISCTATNQLVNSEQIRLGMSIELVCDTTLFASMLDDPCMGYSNYIEERNALILYNSDRSLYLVFGNVTNSSFRRSGGTNSKLLF